MRPGGSAPRSLVVVVVVLGALGVAVAIFWGSADALFLVPFLFFALVGAAVGQWWVIWLAFVWLIPGAFSTGDHFTELGAIILTLLIPVPISAAALALGVLVRRRLSRGRVDRPSAKPA